MCLIAIQCRLDPLTEEKVYMKNDTRRLCLTTSYLVRVRIESLNDLGNRLHNDSRADDKDSCPVEPFQFLVL